MAAFIHWLAPRYREVRAGLKDEIAELRNKAITGSRHARTPGIVADLAMGWKYLLAFAKEKDAITEEKKEELTRLVWSALGEAAAEQDEHGAAAEPVDQFLRLLSGALASGRAHAADLDGGVPTGPTTWGWLAFHGKDGDEEWRQQGSRIGWTDGTDLFLEPEAAYAEAQKMARDQGDSLPVSERTLHKRLKDRGLLITTETGKLTTRRTLQGERRRVIHLLAGILSHQKPGEPGEKPEDLADSCPYQSPFSNGHPGKPGEKSGEKSGVNGASAPVPSIPSVSEAPGRESFEL
jgi:hypothetical protein